MSLRGAMDKEAVDLANGEIENALHETTSNWAVIENLNFERKLKLTCWLIRTTPHPLADNLFADLEPTRAGICAEK